MQKSVLGQSGLKDTKLEFYFKVKVLDHKSVALKFIEIKLISQDTIVKITNNIISIYFSSQQNKFL